MGYISRFFLFSLLVYENTLHLDAKFDCHESHCFGATVCSLLDYGNVRSIMLPSLVAIGVVIIFGVIPFSVLSQVTERHTYNKH